MKDDRASAGLSGSIGLLDALPAAVYVTDAAGRISFYNDAAAELWGFRPELGSAKWHEDWRLFWPDGRPMRHDESPMAVALREGRPVLRVETAGERPDGTRVVFLPYPNAVRDAAGRVTGAINLLIDISSRREMEIAAARLAAIVASSDDAIIGKDLDGIITSWNAGAERIFGYQADEIVGRSVTTLIPHDLQPQEDVILSELRQGRRIEHFDTQRVTRDGRRIDLSLTISPIHDGSGRIVGASKVARDISERKRAEDLQQLLFDELNHRVKNTLAIIQAIASQSMRMASSPGEFMASFNGRMQALARAHDLLVRRKMKGAGLNALVREQVLLDNIGETLDESRIAISGPDVMLDGRVAVQLALVLHELATNARKHGALSVPAGTLSVWWDIDGSRELHLKWQESGVAVKAPRTRGFGTTLIERSLDAEEGEVSIRYGAGGVSCEIKFRLPEEVRHVWDDAPVPRPSPAAPNLRSREDNAGKRILLVEDEPLIAIEIEAELRSRGFLVAGPARDIAGARRLIAEAAYDAALLDANLGGVPVDELAAALAERGIAFAFSTGYGPEALPAAFRDAPILTKPFNARQLVATVEALLRPRTERPGPVAPSDPASAS